MKLLSGALVAVILAFSINIFAQNLPDRCGTIELHELKMQDSVYAAQYAAKIQSVKLYQKQPHQQAKMDCDEILYIPVAVHFMDVDIDMDCAIQMARSQIDSMNLDYAGTNFDITKWEEGKALTWPDIDNKESCIQFCLASLNHPPGLGLTDGDYAVTVNTYAVATNLPAWSGYLNFFVKDMPNPLGFSPLGGSGNGDGVTIGITYFGSVSCGGNTINAQFGLGRTASHEVGHYLSLSHPFDSDDCAIDGDGIADTPITNQETFNCYEVGEELINCEEPVLWPTYMEYVNDACMYMFSEGQVNQMEAYVNTSLQNLLNSATIKCQDALCIDFEVNASKMDETCNGEDGRIAIVATGGTEPYTYSYNEDQIFSSNGIFDDLESGKYVFTVGDASGCTFLDSLIVGRETPPIEILSTTNSFCSDNSGSLSVLVDHPDDFRFKIDQSPYQDSSYFANLAQGTYLITASNDICTTSISVTIGDDTDLEFVVRDFGNVDCPLLDNGLIHLEVPNAQPPVFWRLDDNNLTSSGYFNELSPGSYQVSVEESRGCSAVYKFDIGLSYSTVGADCPCEMYIPNAFTPDFDGVNDIFKLIPSCPITDFRLQIYNKLGHLVFESHSLKKYWNGDAGDGYLVPGDLFFYRVAFRWGEKMNESLNVVTKQGHITVLR